MRTFEVGALMVTVIACWSNCEIAFYGYWPGPACVSLDLFQGCLGKKSVAVNIFLDI